MGREMRQVSETKHTLEIRTYPDSGWRVADVDMYRPAALLTYQGRLIEAIAMAWDILEQARGVMHGVSFRVVTTTRTVTVLGPFEDAIEG